MRKTGSELVKLDQVSPDLGGSFLDRDESVVNAEPRLTRLIAAVGGSYGRKNKFCETKARPELY